MEHLVEISQCDWEAILAGRRPDGRMIRVMDDDGVVRGVRFERFNRQPKPRAADVLLYETANGWLKVSPQRLKIWVSTKRDLGLRRGAYHLLSEVKEIAQYMNRIAIERHEWV